MTSNYKPFIETIAQRFSLDPILVAAQVTIESGGNAWAWNPEPKYRYMWHVRLDKPFRELSQLEIDSEVPPPDFPALAGDADQEWWAQKASWGLLQIMGGVARQLGFHGPFLTELLDPQVNLSLGCQHLSQLLVWANGDATKALAAYNGGKGGNSAPPFRNVGYAQKVLTERDRIKGQS